MLKNSKNFQSETVKHTSQRKQWIKAEDQVKRCFNFLSLC
jgi:hypothetical protein